jgi:hypothetical protein
MEVKRNAHEHIIPERSNPPDDAGLKFLQFLHRADDVAGMNEAQVVRDLKIDSGSYGKQEVRKYEIQIFVRCGKDVGAFTIHEVNDLWTCIRKRWGDLEQGYELTPRFKLQRNDAGYFLIHQPGNTKLTQSRLKQKGDSPRSDVWRYDARCIMTSR